MRLHRGRKPAALLELPEKKPLAFATEPDGAVFAEVRDLRVFWMLALEYRP